MPRPSVATMPRIMAIQPLVDIDPPPSPPAMPQPSYRMTSASPSNASRSATTVPVILPLPFGMAQLRPIDKVHGRQEVHLGQGCIDTGSGHIRLEEDANTLDHIPSQPPRRRRLQGCGQPR